MKTLFLLFASAALLSAEELKPAALSALSTCTDGNYQIRFDGKKQLALDFPMKLEPGNWYRIQFDARSQRGPGAENLLSALRLGNLNRYQAFQVNTAWSRHVNFFYAQEADGQYSLILKRSQPDTVEFRNLRCTKLNDADFRRNLFPDGDFESGDPAVPSFPWRKGGTAEPADCGFLTGEYSLVLRNPRSPHSAPYMISATLPVRPGKPYRLSLWIKANGNGSVCLTFETLRKEISVSNEWQKIEWRFTPPAGFPRMARLMIRMQHELRTLMLDCVSFSEQ
mgnify:CR=1 FL=1